MLKNTSVLVKKLKRMAQLSDVSFQIKTLKEIEPWVNHSTELTAATRRGRGQDLWFPASVKLSDFTLELVSMMSKN